MWGPHSVDRFADEFNTKLRTFNSKYWSPKTAHVDAFTCDWAGAQNWLVPPITLRTFADRRFLICFRDGVTGDLNLEKALLASRAPNTVAKYSRAFENWKAWSLSRNISYLPAIKDDIASYLIKLYNEEAPYSRIESAFYAIKWYHDCSLLVKNNPCEYKILHLLLNGLKRLSQKPVPEKRAKKEPITPEMLHAIVGKNCSPDSLAGCELCAMLLISYAGFLRHSELAELRVCDIQYFGSYMRLFIVKSKTDQFKNGVWLIIAATGKITCPVSMFYRYITLAGIQLDGSDQYLFRPLVFMKSSGKYFLRAGKMSYSRCRDLLKEALVGIGVDSKRFGLHSLRAGGATAAANIGIPDRLFKKHGRWRSESAKDGYVTESLQRQLAVSMSLGI
ncbi:LOW QUALITY PROTEIN: integrase/recombinase xerD homolog [Amphiura filiformis]|uniref:LOW QUALITY PROTEIN: integrase/recombinase xerD homolog n=1 Tax=Amphiura filiformis TaxID=82378 RepID=UPI003B21C9D6